MRLLLVIFMLVTVAGCASNTAQCQRNTPADPFIIVLGIAQDAGYPQAACRKDCCRRAWYDPTMRRRVACLGIIDPVSGQRWMIDATPDFREQLRMLDAVAPPPDKAGRSQPGLEGILLTHAHIGHYTGLQHLGREVIGARSVPVYVMPRMREFLTINGPWSQLVELNNIELRDLEADRPVALSDRITVTPLLVPHRDEFSETVGFRIDGLGRTVLYVPDIDKWEKWYRDIEVELNHVDVALLDGTFYRDGEIPGRDMSEIPHPFIEETIARLAPLPAVQRAKVRFIHFNHTNPAIIDTSSASASIRAAGFNVARELDRISLGGGQTH